MEAKRIDEFHKHGCNFYGKLVVVDYSEDMKNDPQSGKFGANLFLDYYVKAKALIKERQYKVVKELLGIPVLVVEVE